MNTYERLVLRLLLAIAKTVIVGKTEIGFKFDMALMEETARFLDETPKM